MPTISPDSATKQAGNNNPTGIGGFQDHPELINKGGRYPRAQSFTYWFEQFKMMTVTELEQWEIDNPDNKRTVASNLALTRVKNAVKDLKEFQEVANRSEGMPTQNHKIGGADGSAIEIIVKEFE